MPSTTSSSVSSDFASSTVITPSLPDLFHRIGKELANFGIAVGGNRSDLGDFLVRGDLLRILLQFLAHRFDRKIDAALEIHRVHAGGYGLGAFPYDRVRKNRGGRGAVTGVVG